MPTINRPHKPHPDRRNKSDLIYRTVYNTRRWRSLRAAYLLDHPLCERCLANGLTVPAEDVHHKVRISTAETPNEMMDIAFNPENLESLCRECHQKEHGANAISIEEFEEKFGF